MENLESIRFKKTKIPARAGVGFRLQHTSDFLDMRPPVDWIEVHAENYLDEGGPRLRALVTLRQDYPLSIHGVGLSLGSAEGLDRRHLQQVAMLVERLEPGLVSEHIAWSVSGGVYFSDLLPLPYNSESLEVLCGNIQQIQDVMKRQLLIENPSSYVAFTSSTMTEGEFITEVVRHTGCGLILDLNNIHVSATNHGFDSQGYLDSVPLGEVREIHLGGHAGDDDAGLLIDDHSTPVADPVWRLFEDVLGYIGRVPTLVEWDSQIPPLAVLLGEADKAQRRLDAIGMASGGAETSR